MAKATDQRITGDEYRDEIRDLIEDMELFFEDVDVEAVHETMQEGNFEEAFDMMGLTPDQAESVMRSWRARALTILTRSGRD